MATTKREKKKAMLNSDVMALAQRPDVADLITVQEASRLKGGVATASIFQLIARGRLSSEKLLGRTLVYRSEIENFVPKKPSGRPKGKAKAKSAE